MPCPSRLNNTCPIIHSPVQMSAPSPVQNLYQTKSPATAPSPLPFTTLPQSKSPASHGTFATQVCSPIQPNTSPAPLIASSPVPAQAIGQPQVAPSVAAALSIGSGATSVGAPMVQFLSAPAANPTTASLRVSSNAMKPIQPKQTQILPKPAGGTGQNQYSGSLNKQVTVNHRNAMAMAPTQSSPIVIGQNQATVLPNHNVTMSGQGTLLFNGISLGLAQNPFLIQGSAGGLQNLQLLVRPQQSGTITASSSQQNAQQGVNPAALLAAWQVQNQAAQQALLTPAKGQTVVIPGTNIITSSPQQTTLATNQTLHTRPNVIVNQRMVNGNQGALQIQQIQTAHGPIALAIAPQQIRSIHGANITLANAPATSGAGTVGSVIQGVTIPQASQSQLQSTALQAGVVLNSHSLTQSQSSSLTPVTVTLSQETVPMTTHQPSQSLNITKPPSVNLEELLKQAGIVPSDPVPSIQQSQTTTAVVTNNILTTSSVVTMTQSQPVITQLQNTSQPTVVLNSAQVPISSPSQLITQLQPSVNLNQPQQSQGPLKLSINPVGSVFLQRPLVATSNITQPTFTATTTVTSSEVQSIPSMLLQRLNDVPQVSAALSEPAASLIPLTVQNINLSTPVQSSTILAVSSHSATTSTSVMHTSIAPTTTVSGLIQTHPTLVQSLGQSTGLRSSLPILAPNVNQKLKLQQVAPQQNNSLANHQSATGSSLQTLPVRTVTATTTVTPTVISASIPTVTAIVKSEPNLFFSNSPINTLSAGQKVQTIQLTQQNQENLQKIQTQLCFLLNQKNHTPHQRQQIQQLQATQQKILSQGKIISIQQSPHQTIQLVQHPIQQQQILSSQTQKVPSITQSTNIQPTVLTTSSATTPNTTTAQQIISKQNVHLTNLLKHVPSQSATVRVVSTIAQSTPASAATTTVTVPTQMKIGNQLITLTSQQRQTFHQLQQQLKTLTPEQQQIYLTQNKQAVFLKLQQQQQLNTTTGQNANASGTSVFTPSSATGTSTIAVATNSSLAGGLLVIQTFGKGIAQVKSLVPTIVQEQTNRGIKRPAPTPLSQTALFQKQLASDEQGALHPDCKTPFCSVSDACKRLLKYHVFNSKTPKQDDLQKADDLFETASRQLLEKAHNVYGKYRYLLYKESMREFPSAEVVMLEKLFIEDEKEALKNDKKDAEEGKIVDLPPLPEHWLEKNVYKDLSTTTSVTTAGTATTQASSRVTTTTTTVHVAPLLSSSPVVSDKKDDNHSGKNSQATVHLSNISESEKLPNNKTSFVVQKPKDHKTEKSSCIGCTVKKEVIKMEDDKNYDEWAEIQKELEMYPLESDHTDNLELTTPQVDFEPPESSSTLADFEPPIMKTCSSNSSVTTYLGGTESDTRLNTSVQTINNSNGIERMDTSTEWNVYNRGQVNGESDNSPLNNESQAAVESILQPEDSQLDLSDIEEFNRHYSSDQDVEDTNPSIRCNGVKEEKELLMPSTLLMEGVDGDDIAIEQSLRSPDDDLNAQVESAINSILNLQRTDEAFEYEATNAYQLDDIEPKEEEQMNLDYVSPPLELDTCEVVDAALEEAVKSILM